ncbi:DUF2865 domain-containing protein [Pseudorhodoplanes sp.]|uniref:DUF2865 domain-containing protein n=1 Tax=Pseudorhodoplanes sp. TaxID=1934341 RepID=UPI00391C27B1
MARGGVRLRPWRLATIAGLAALLLVEAPAPASAQNIFESLFGGFKRAMTPPRAPAMANSNHAGGDSHHGGGLSSGYCVRLCDGRYFPVSGRGRMSAAEMCRSFCPHAPTQIFSSGGGNIANAVAPNGQRYVDLPNAFVYRDKVVADCTCNGQSPMGLVPFDDEDDPTLRPGDIVATNEGLMTYRNDGRYSAFVPAASAPGLPPALRERLTATRVAPTPTVVETEGAAGSDAVASHDAEPRSQTVR